MIKTERLQLKFPHKTLLEALIRDDREFAAMIGCDLAEGWLQFPESTPYALKMLKNEPAGFGWGMCLFVHMADNRVIGTGGFKGSPDKQGMVELGYAVAPACRNRGFATEAAGGMIEYAFSSPLVHMVDAHTLAEFNASTRVLEKCGMRKIGERHDEEDGDVWQWQIIRNEYGAGQKSGRRV